MDAGAGRRVVALAFLLSVHVYAVASSSLSRPIVGPRARSGLPNMVDDRRTEGRVTVRPREFWMASPIGRQYGWAQLVLLATPCAELSRAALHQASPELFSTPLRSGVGMRLARAHCACDARSALVTSALPYVYGIGSDGKQLNVEALPRWNWRRPEKV